ncbi:hypothetical protein RND81_11G124200 [Saponaria officinalis]|uniref:SWIM-type domain-containing protein n=1 Tax=Saponaria officinalis TaxID=3572 RepID=A0AAW1HM93_SAPOF
MPTFDLNDFFDVEDDAGNEVVGENEFVAENVEGSDLVQRVTVVFEGGDDPGPPTEPTVDMEFDSGEQFAALCFMYAYKTGFQFHVRSSDLLDVYKEKRVRRNGAGDNEAQFHIMKRIRLVCTKLRMMLNDRAGIPMTRNFNTLVLEGGGYENIPFNYRDMRNAINQERRRGRFGGDAHELISYFDILKRENPEFYFAVQKDVNGALLNVFWADARCRAMHKAFGDPVSYDTTFLSNRYLMPFFPFVGVNHHGSTVIFAAALVSYEDKATFEWVFKRWIECMGRAPIVMLTDQCKAIEGAIRKHILQNADKNLRSHPQFTAIDRDMRALVHESTTEDEFQNLWAEMVEKYSLRQNPLVTEACEQSNRFFKSFVSIEIGLKQFIEQYEFALKRKAEEENMFNFADKNKPLKWDQGILSEDVFHKVYTNKKFQEVNDEVYGCINTNVETLPNILGSVKMFRATSKVNEPFWKKERRSFDVSINTVSDEYKCGCKLFEFKGIVCRHIIKCLDVLDVNIIPDKYILARWRKDLVRGYENIRVGYYDPGQSKRVK